MRRAAPLLVFTGLVGWLPADAVGQHGCSHSACVNYECQVVNEPGTDDCTACLGCDPTGALALDCLSRNGRWDPALCVCSPPLCSNSEASQCLSDWGTWDPWMCMCWNACNAGPPLEVGLESYSELLYCIYTAFACYQGMVNDYTITYYERQCMDGRVWESYGVGDGRLVQQWVWPYCGNFCWEYPWAPPAEGEPVAVNVSGRGTSDIPGTPGVTLRDRAELAGRILVEPYPDCGEVTSASVAELFRRSPIVVIGKVMAQRAHLAADGQSVTTDIAVDTQEVLRGPIVPGQVVRVSLPGGSHRFDDGIIVHQTTPGYQKPHTGGTYVLFLRESRPPLSDKTEYELAVGKQGQFELDFTGGRVIPGFEGGELVDAIATRARKTPLAGFLVELHAARRGGN